MLGHPVQLAYLKAQAYVEVLCAAYEVLAASLNAQVDAAVLDEDAWAQACNDLEDALGLTAARQTRDEARSALIAWGLAQVQALWLTCGALFPGHSLASLEALFACPEAQRRLVPVVLRLRDWVEERS